ncbi:MAG: lytic transglycosylase domain-containing protein [Clostridia bacterium]|nr:lytic transglycosylase domain-containing protein [Clostridia bacterium]
MDKFLIYAIIKAESNFDETAVSSKEAKGLMQLMDNTAKYIIKTENITNSYTEESSIDSNKISEILLKPDINIKLGTKYISILINKYKSIELALVAYNAGSGNVDNWIEKGILKDDGANIEEVPYKETNNYVRKILRDYEIYKDLYENN